MLKKYSIHERFPKDYTANDELMNRVKRIRELSEQMGNYCTLKTYKKKVF